MEKRVFIAIFLSFIVLAVYQTLVGPGPAPPANRPDTPPTASPAPSTSAGSAPPPAAALPAATPLVADPAAQDVVVETDAIRAVFSTSGATLKSWSLKHYLENGQPLDLIPPDLPDTLARPFTLVTNDPALSATLATALFRPSATSLTLGPAPGRLSFEYSVSGVNARKTFYFQPEGKVYIVKVEAAVDVGGTSRPTTLTSGPALGLGYDPANSKAKPADAVQWHAGRLDRLSADALKDRAKYQGEFKFAGADNQYFLNAVLPGAEAVTVEYTPISLPVPNDPEGRLRTFVSYSVTAPGSVALQYFLGPKDFDILKAVDPRLELVRAIDFGMFTWLVVPLLQALKWINGFLGNYGWSIIVLTILINLVIFPLRHKSMVSMRKMQSLQPEMKAIQERYAKFKVTDPERQKMNQEMMALYKQRGVNPASGCVPMLLTMPVLFAFYSMLYAAIELRGAPFMGWITDLSRHDPWYVTPVLMGLTMLWQQRITPTTADPVQQKIFMLMPVFFLVFFLWAPAGLVLYWFVSNLLAIGQQYTTNRLIGAPAVPVRAAPARQTKAANVGGKP